MRQYIAAVGCLVVFATSARTADGCWWKRHCHCGQGSSYRSSPSSALAAPTPTSAPTYQTVAAPTYYQPVMMAPLTQAAPSQSLVGSLIGIGGIRGITDELKGVVELLKLVKSLRDRDTGETGGGAGGGSSDASVHAKLDLIIEGQEDMKGRLVNNAGIGQAIGERLVEVDAKLDKIIQGNVQAVAENEDDESGEAAAATDAAAEDQTLASQVAEIRERISDLEEKLDDLEGALDRKLEDKLTSKLDALAEELTDAMVKMLRETADASSADDSEP